MLFKKIVEKCPKCGSTFLGYDKTTKEYRCILCGYTFKEEVK
jgi:ribosomal protein S27AE